MGKGMGNEMNVEQATLQRQRTRKVEVTVVFDQNARATERIVVNIGGSRSSKSYSIAQLMVKKFNEERDKNLLSTRKTLPALRTTAYRVAVDMMKDYGCYQYFTHNKSERTIYNPYKNNLWIFTSIDDPEKIKSTEYNYIHMEEANEFTYDDYMILKLRMSGKEGPGERNQMYLSLNPSQKHGWVNEILLPQQRVKVIHSTYKDAVRFLPASYVKELEALREEDPSYWQVYGLGEFADIKGLIHRLHIIPKLPAEPEEVIYGLDYGYTNPSALIEIGIDMERMELYLREIIYETGLTNRQLIDEMKDKIPKEHRQREIYADSAEPGRIEEMYYAGFNIHAADKGKNSVTNGIDVVNRFRLCSTAESVNLNREMTQYKRKVDREGHVLEEPVKFNDHCPNAVRYPVFTHLWDRLLEPEGTWTVRAGQIIEKGEEKQAPEANGATRAPVPAERKEGNAVGSEEVQGSDEKPESEEGGDGGSWVV